MHKKTPTKPNRKTPGRWVRRQNEGGRSVPKAAAYVRNNLGGAIRKLSAE